MTSDVHQREREVTTSAALHRLVDPDHGKWFKQSRAFQGAGINWLETELSNELHHLWLFPGIVAGDEHDESPVGGKYAATLEVTDPIVDSRSGTFGIRLLLPNSGNEMPAGLRCKIYFPATGVVDGGLNHNLR
jgi:hypothetical protein